MRNRQKRGENHPQGKIWQKNTRLRRRYAHFRGCIMATDLRCWMKYWAGSEEGHPQRFCIKTCWSKEAESEVKLFLPHWETLSMSFTKKYNNWKISNWREATVIIFRTEKGVRTMKEKTIGRQCDPQPVQPMATEPVMVGCPSSLQKPWSSDGGHVLHVHNPATLGDGEWGLTQRPCPWQVGMKRTILSGPIIQHGLLPTVCVTVFLRLIRFISTSQTKLPADPSVCINTLSYRISPTDINFECYS